MSRAAWEKMLTQGGQGAKGGKPHKYGAVARTTPDGVKHPSTGQAKRWMFLQQCQQVGLIKDLQREVPFDLVVNGVKVCRYIADHTYMLAGDLLAEYQARQRKNPTTELPHIVEDFKGHITPEARLKMRLFEAVKGMPVKVVKNPNDGIA